MWGSISFWPVKTLTRRHSLDPKMQTQEMEADSLVVQDELLTSGPNENGFDTGQVLNRAETVTLAKLKAFRFLNELAPSMGKRPAFNWQLAR